MRQSKNSRWWRPHVVIALTAVAWLTVSHRQNLIESLAALAPEKRSWEGRLHGFPYRPIDAQVRGRDNPVDDNAGTARSLGFLTKTIKAVQRRRSVENLHAASIANLTLGHADRALAVITDALTTETGDDDLPNAIRASGDAALLNDLSVVAIAGKTSADVALEAALRLRQLGRSPAAAWNCALALERSGLRDQALIAWRDYLQHDRTSPWATEARTHVQRLEADSSLISAPPSYDEVERQLEADGLGLIGVSPNVCRAYLDERLFPALVRSAAAQDVAAARRLLFLAENLLRVTQTTGGDPSLPEVAVDLGRVLIDHPHSARAVSFAAAVRCYVRATTEYRGNDVESARRDFETARAPIRQYSTELSEWIDFYLACCAYYDNAYENCLSRLRPERDGALLRRGWRALVAKRRWLRGLTFAVQNRRNESLAELEAAETLFSALGERDNVASVASLVAEGREYLGDRDAAARSRRVALTLLPTVADPLRRGKILNEAVEAAVNKDLLWSALLLQGAAVGEASRSGRILDAADAFMWRGLIWSRLHKVRPAEADFAQAAALILRLRDANVRKKTAADLTFFRAVSVQQGADDDALESAADFYRTAGNRVRLAETYRLRAAIAIRRGDLRRGEALLRSSLGEIRADEERLSETASKLIYAASAPEVAAMAAEEFLARGDVDRAFSLLEEVRDMRVMDLSAPAARLPYRTAAVIYFIGDHISRAWVLRGRSMHSVELSCHRRDLRLLTDVLAERLPEQGTADRQVREASSHLYDALIAPLAAFLLGASSIAVIPDETVANVPFPALRDSRSGRFWIEDAVITDAPSVSGFLRASQMGSEAMALPLDAATVVMTNSAAGGSIPLPELHREVAAVRGVCRSVRVIGAAGENGREAAVNAFARSRLLHFAGHGEFNAASPADSALIVGGVDGAAARLTAREIVAFSPAAKLVVLAACDSGRSSRVLPSASIAQWLVAVGVTSVVATVSRVDNAAAADLVRDFYRCLKQSPDSASALRSAQIAAMRRGDVIGWPAFVHFGAPQKFNNNGGSNHEFHHH